MLLPAGDDLLHFLQYSSSEAVSDPSTAHYIQLFHQQVVADLSSVTVESYLQAMTCFTFFSTALVKQSATLQIIDSWKQNIRTTAHETDN
jgi:hypothetical protein